MQNVYDGIKAGMMLFQPATNTEHTHDGMQPQPGSDAVKAQFLAQKKYIQLLSSFEVTPQELEVVDDKEDETHPKILEQIEIINGYESRMIEKMSHAMVSLQNDYRTSEVKRIDVTDLIAFEACLQAARCVFYKNNKLVLHSYYDVAVGVLLLESLERVTLTGPLEIKRLYCMGSFEIESSVIKAELFAKEGDFFSKNTSFDSRLFVFSGSNITLQETLLKTDILLLKSATNIADTQLQPKYCRMQGKLMISNTDIIADLYHIDAPQAGITKLDAQIECLVLLEKNSLALTIVFGECSLGINHLFAHQGCAFLNTKLITKDNVCLSQGTFVFSESQWIGSKLIHVFQHAMIKTNLGCRFKFHHFIMDGTMSLEESTLKCGHMRQHKELILKNATLEASFLGTSKNSTTVLSERVKIIAKNADIHGIFSLENSTSIDVQTFIIKNKFDFNKTASIHAGEGHIRIEANTLNIRGVIKVQGLRMMGDVLNLSGELAACVATLKMKRHVYNRGKLISDTLTIEGNFSNIVGTVIVRTQLFIREGLMVANLAGTMVVNNAQSKNRLHANLGLHIPYLFADSKTLMTYLNACVLAKNVMPIVGAGIAGSCVVYFAEKLPYVAEQCINALKDSPSSSASSIEKLWLCKTMMLNELKSVYRETKLALPTRDDDSSICEGITTHTDEDWVVLSEEEHDTQSYIM
ncbi:MAG: hypothetical protein CK424_07055 [Legionella sp.]|nr:MAG: hypothetical protein CK424_07055 [Legionella sp.]